MREDSGGPSALRPGPQKLSLSSPFSLHLLIFLLFPLSLSPSLSYSVPPTSFPSISDFSSSRIGIPSWTHEVWDSTWPHEMQDPPYPVLTWEMQQVPVPWLDPWIHPHLDVGEASHLIHEQGWGLVPWSTPSPSSLTSLAPQRGGGGEGDPEESNSLQPKISYTFFRKSHCFKSSRVVSGICNLRTFRVACVMSRAPEPLKAHPAGCPGLSLLWRQCSQTQPL